MVVRGVGVNVGQHGARIRQTHGPLGKLRGHYARWRRDRIVLESATAQIIMEHFVELLRRHPKRLLDRLFNGFLLIEPCVIMHHEARLRIKHAAMIPALVISLRILLHAKQIGNSHHSGLLKDAIGLLGDLANARFFVIDLDA